MSQKGIVVIGCGNPLRGDDRVAHLLIERLESGGGMDGVQFEEGHQLTPEMAELVAGASAAIIIDAEVCGGGRPGEVKVRQLEPATAEMSPSGLSHDFDPETLLATAKSLYDAAPLIHVVTITGGEFEHSEKLSSEVEAALPQAEAAVREIIKAAKSKL